METKKKCPACGSADLTPFYEVDGTPVHSVSLIRRREDALSFPCGRILLCLCEECGFIHNSAFEPERLFYDVRYEATQGFSETFLRFNRALAERLISRYSLQRKRLLEIGCGKGEFLALLCELGGNQGIGFDPCWEPGRTPPLASGQVEFVQDFYSERHRGVEADFICCKMTLEHISAVNAFLKMVRDNIGQREGVVVFVQVPDALRVFDAVAFWDVYYEHCSYFSSGSLRWLFKASGFEVDEVECDYDGQYLMVAGRTTGDGLSRQDLRAVENRDDVRRAAFRFAVEVREKMKGWRKFLADCDSRKRKVVLWGGGSKAVSLLTTLGESRPVEYVVDINPHKWGTYIPGTGQAVVEPSFLRSYRPDYVVAMNPVYSAEIHRQLLGMGLDPVLLSADDANVLAGQEPNHRALA